MTLKHGFTVNAVLTRGPYKSRCGSGQHCHAKHVNVLCTIEWALSYSVSRGFGLVTEGPVFCLVTEGPVSMRKRWLDPGPRPVPFPAAGPLMSFSLLALPWSQERLRLPSNHKGALDTHWSSGTL